MGKSRDAFRAFDPARAAGPRRRPDVGRDVTAELLGGAAGAPGGPAAAPLTVSRLVARVKGALAAAFPQPVAVVGEISNFKRHSSGHLYFSLKDASSAIDAVMFRSDAGRLRFEPSDGLEVVAEGRVDVYDVRGQLQLYVQTMTPKGAGALELAFRQLKDALQREGLFDPSRKRQPVRFPRAVGIVTSPTGAAIRDIRRTLGRRWPAAPAYLLPVLVQGEGAAEQIARAVALLDAGAERLEIDTIIVARGGGSLEDLWAFNEEVVARAVAAARTPIISGVGHETDVTICDLVADVRAATPTAAAELAVPDAAEVRRGVTETALRLERLASRRVADARTALSAVCRSAALRDPASRLRTQMQHVDELLHRLRASLRGALSAARRRLEPAGEKLAAFHPARLAERAAGRIGMLASRLAWVLGGRSKRAGDALAEVIGRFRAAEPRHTLSLARQKIDAAERQLEAMSYRSVLRRGFSVTRGPRGAILRGVGQVTAGQRIETELADGRFHSRTEGARPPADPLQRAGPTLFDET